MKTYVINLNYDKRMSEHKFLKETLLKYDEQTLTGSMMYIDNYTRKMKWVLSFDGQNKEKHDFDIWLKEQKREIDKTYQKRVEESQSYFLEKGWNCVSIYTPEDVNRFITCMPNGVFLYGATN